MNGLFTRKVLTGLLQTAYRRRIDMILPFLRVSMELVSYQKEICSTTTMFTDNVDIIADLCVITKREKWNEEKLAMLAERIKTIKYNKFAIFRVSKILYMSRQLAFVRSYF